MRGVTQSLTTVFTEPERTDTEASARRPWWVWLVPSAVLFTILIAQNSFLFSAPIYEQGDSAADSILIRQALRLRLLVGHYSREGFNHPGPAYLYVQAAGQWLARDVLHIVPTGWNGQLLAVFALGAAFTGIAVMIVYGWTRSPVAAAMAFAVICGMIAFHTVIPISGWPPDMFVLTYLVFLLAAASVAGRQSRDLWVLALSGWFLIHGYAPFLFFVPLTLVVTAAIALWPSRRRLRADLRAFARDRRRQWIPAVAISAVFILPIALNLALHWPGQFGAYISYSESGRAGGHPASQVLGFMAWFWGPQPLRGVPQLACVVAAPSVIAWLTRGTTRRCLGALMIMAWITAMAFAYYAATVADYLSNFYIGYFFWSVPCVFMLIVVVGVTQALPSFARAAIAVASAAAAVWALAFGVVLRADTHDNDPALPAAVAAVAARSHGAPLVLEVADDAWPQAVGFLLQAERTGVRFCVTDPSGAYRVVTDHFACAPGETGARYTVGSAAPGIARFGTATSGYVTVSPSR
jgi:hypothetical protein